MKRPGARHLAVVAGKEKKTGPGPVVHRLQDSSPDLAEALERAAEKYGASMVPTPNAKFTHCLCGELTRCQLLPETAETRAAGITMYGALCSGCKRPVQVVFAQPQQRVQLAAAGELPPAPEPH